jgi:hypothetical protein
MKRDKYLDWMLGFVAAFLFAIILMATICGDGNCGLMDLF